MNTDEFKKMMTEQVRYFKESGVDTHAMTQEDIANMSLSFREAYHAIKANQDNPETGTDSDK